MVLILDRERAVSKAFEALESEERTEKNKRLIFHVVNALADEIYTAMAVLKKEERESGRRD